MLPMLKGNGTCVPSAVVFASALVAAGPQPTHAQAVEPPFDAAIDLQLFEYATGRHTFLTVPDADVSGAQQFSVDVLMTFLTNPFVIYNVNLGEEIESTRTNVVDSLVAGHIGGSFGLSDSLEVGLSLPVVFALNGEGIDVAMASAGDGLRASGIGDLRAEVKWRAWRKDNLRVAVLPGITIPTSIGTNPGGDIGAGDLLGDNLPSVRARAAAQWTSASGRLHAGGTLGALFRKPREIYSSEVGQQLLYGAGASLQVSDKVNFITELFGRAGLTTFDVDANPLELNGALRLAATPSVAVLAGGGGGLVRGIGSPGLRMFLSVGWSPDLRDDDGDGIPNLRDDCPLLAEDRDDFEDADGCPDEDNDGDRREDSIDRCPNEAEDLDGFEDEDGCPEPDNDKDGLNDADDRCPNDAEDGKPPFPNDGCPADKRDSDDDGIVDAFDRCPNAREDLDGFEDWDGCPDPDNDGDGIEDDKDACPLCAEDRDGFEDDDGCPEIDNDKDGVLDAQDKCPDQAEVLNGIDDFDGCPDSGGIALVSLDGDRMTINGAVTFARGKDVLDARGKIFADQIAVLMNRHAEVSVWRVVAAAPRGASDDETRSRSERRAAQVKQHLVSRGVAEERIEAIGALSDNATVVVVVRERIDPEQSGAFCPAGARAVAKEPPTEPTSVPAAAPEAAARQQPAAAEVPAAPASVPETFARFSGASKELSFRRDKLQRGGRTYLDKLIVLLQEHSQVKVEIQARVSSGKGADKAAASAQAQANAVASYLKEKGIAGDRVTITTHEPDGEAAKQASARVEFVFAVD
jgi:OmpA-OmpF porin, OOP family